MTTPLALLTVGQAAERLQVTDKTIRNWLHAGRIPYIKISTGAIRIKSTDLEAFLNANYHE